MGERRRIRILLAVLTMIALVLITIDYRQGDDGVLASVRQGALVVFGPVQEGFSRVVQPIGNVVASVGDLTSLRADNAALRDEVEALREDLASLEDLRRENSELRDLLAMREEHDLETTAARVIGQPPGERSNTVLIDAGADEGIESGMVVISSRGLVGKIVELTGSHARVELLTSPTAHYAVRVAETGDTGLLRGRGADPFQLELLDPEADAPDGTEVVTRTFQASTVPDGLPIGEVVPQSGDDAVGPRFQLVRPYVDFRRLSIVQVVLDAPEPPEDLDPEELVDPPEGERPPPPGDTDDEEEGQGDNDEDGGEGSADDAAPEEEGEVAGG